MEPDEQTIDISTDQIIVLSEYQEEFNENYIDLFDDTESPFPLSEEEEERELVCR